MIVLRLEKAVWKIDPMMKESITNVGYSAKSNDILSDGPHTDYIARDVQVIPKHTPVEYYQERGTTKASGVLISHPSSSLSSLYRDKCQSLGFNQVFHLPYPRRPVMFEDERHE